MLLHPSRPIVPRGCMSLDPPPKLLPKPSVWLTLLSRIILAFSGYTIPKRSGIDFPTCKCAPMMCVSRRRHLDHLIPSAASCGAILKGPEAKGEEVSSLPLSCIAQKLPLSSIPAPCIPAPVFSPPPQRKDQKVSRIFTWVPCMTPSR